MKETNNCPSCGGVLEYYPKFGGLRCQSCGSVKPIVSNSNITSRTIDPIKELDIKVKSSGVLKCMNCGASFSENTKNISSECKYCGSNMIEDLDFVRGLVPNGIIPFRISKEDAKEEFKKWVNGNWYAPKAFKKIVKKFEPESVYVPIFQYYMDCSTAYQGRLYKRVQDDDGTETIYKNVSGNTNTNYGPLSIECSNYITQAMYNGISPFEQSGAVVFDKSYVMGYSVEHPNIEVMEGREKAKEINTKLIKDSIVKSYQYDGYDYLDTSTTFKSINFRYMIMPVYRVKMDYKGKTTYAYLNGQTGKKNGKLPKSAWKILLTVLMCLGAVGLIVLLALL